MVEALARALRLDAGEREHLFRLAGLQASGRGTVPGHITPGAQRLLDRLTDTPVAAVYDAMWKLLLANDFWTALMSEQPEPNIVRSHFLGARQDRMRQSPEANAAFEGAAVCGLRAAATHHPADVNLRNLVAELLANSAALAAL